MHLSTCHEGLLVPRQGCSCPVPAYAACWEYRIKKLIKSMKIRIFYELVRQLLNITWNDLSLLLNS
jgi:hypothetical protein